MVLKNKVSLVSLHQWTYGPLMINCSQINSVNSTQINSLESAQINLLNSNRSVDWSFPLIGRLIALLNWIDCSDLFFTHSLYLLRYLRGVYYEEV
nr:MAG TPA: hypothetical protein [Caudoviricetes sp.]